MRPLQGLQRIGKVIFRWVAVVSIAVSIAIAAGPHLGTASFAGSIATTVSQIQQGTFVLTLCLLLFVCFAIRPLGLTFRSRIFGVTLGLGLTATAFLVQAAWISTMGAGSHVFADLPVKHDRFARFQSAFGEFTSSCRSQSAR